MRTTFVKTTAASLAILTGVVGIAGAGAAFAQDNGSAPAATQDANARHGQLRHRVAKAAIKDAADAIGISPKDLVAALRDGQTVSQVAQAHGVDPATVSAKLVSDASARIDQAVSEGKISQEVGDKLKAKLPARVETLMNRTFGQGR